jgi:hypothetical protein
MEPWYKMNETTCSPITMLLLNNLSERNQFNIENAAIDFYLEIKWFISEK